MTVRSLEDLRKPDDRALHYTPLGLGWMPAEAAAKYQQETVAVELAPDVSEGTRRKFEDLKKVFAYGVLCYEIYTLVHDHAYLVYEQALRDRFMEYVDGTVVRVDQAGVEHTISVTTYEKLCRTLRRCSHKNRRVRLHNGKVVTFADGGLSDLQGWAHAAGLLRGRRNRAIGGVQRRLRNFVAHAHAYHLTDPVDAARTMRDLAETINQLWGTPTPNGRLYPPPMRREAVVLAWPDDGSELIIASAAEAFAEDPGDSPWVCVLVRAAVDSAGRVNDHALTHYDSRVEATDYPVDLLWGPGSVRAAADWFTRTEPQPDEVDHLDRLFLVRHSDAGLHRPMRPSFAAALPPEERTGTWHAVRADRPGDAFRHVAGLIRKDCVEGDCGCPVEEVVAGAHQVVLSKVHPAPGTALPADVRTPYAGPRVEPLAE